MNIGRDDIILESYDNILPHGIIKCKQGLSVAIHTL